jgi:hypothetical protein
MRGILIVVGMLFSIAIIACGGGSDGDGGGGNTLTPAAVDDTTAAEAVSMATAAAPLMALDEEFEILSASSDTEPSQKVADWVLRRVKEEIFSTALYQAAGSASESENCTTGNMTMNITWDGPDAVTDCSQASNVNATIQFNQCSEEGGSYIDGTIYLHISGNMCNPSTMSMDFDNVNIQSDDVNASMNSFSIDFSMSGDTTSATFNGDVSGSSDGVSHAMNFSNFKITDTETSEGNSAIISGAISGGCFTGWLTFATIEPVLTPYYGNCPTSGQVTLSGDGEVTVIFNSDSSIIVGDTVYASCEDLPQTCQ